MTPERKAYLAKCSKREKYLRMAIKDSKIAIRDFKRDLKIERLFSRNTDLLLIRHNKMKLNAYRHELARLKGMDRVVVPYELMRFGFKANVPRVSYNCECFEPVDRKYKFCPSCGRRILWEKVK